MALAKDHVIERGPPYVSALHRVLATSDSAWTIWIRLAVGLVFLPEGIQKLLFPDILGSGRFAAIGLPYPGVLGPFVGGVELRRKALWDVTRPQLTYQDVFLQADVVAPRENKVAVQSAEQPAGGPVAP